jgi:aminoglycoside phosphotransferase (APT) family kinase protein
LLRQHEIVPYLIDAGVIQDRTLLNGGIRVIDASRRNHVFVVGGDRPPAHVVKQSRSNDDPALAREAAVLRSLASLEPPGQLDGLLPRLVTYDATERILVLETEPGARNLSEQYARRRFSTALARACGRALALVHHLPPDAAGARPHGLDPAWPLSWHRPWLEQLSDLSAAGVELLRLTQSSTAMCDALDDLRDSCRHASLIHGDARWENWIALPAPASRGRTRIVLADWELTGPGDPCVDVGAVIGEYLLAWLESIPVIDGCDFGRLLNYAQVPLDRLRPSIRSFWFAYVAAGGRHSLQRAVRFTALRLIQAAVEQTRASTELRAHTILALQCAANVLRRPDDAVNRLLGIPWVDA